jgi:hypothetical protein
VGIEGVWKPASSLLHLVVSNEKNAKNTKYSVFSGVKQLTAGKVNVTIETQKWWQVETWGKPSGFSDCVNEKPSQKKDIFSFVSRSALSFGGR